MDKRLCFVQFMHPGGEHQPEKKRDEKDWNEGDDHRRKFLKSRGRYLENGEEVEGEIIFWGEWEPQSRVVSTYTRPEPDGPRFLYAPHYTPLSDRSKCQNTDPFVFGEHFHYTGCQQHMKSGRPTQLRDLDPGSLVLFGSCKDRHFVIDTVFVVSHHIDHTDSDWETVLKGRISPTYQSVTIEPWYRRSLQSGRSHRLYFGATPENPICGMFSFFPCQPYKKCGPGFPRPSIAIDKIITPTLKQKYKITGGLSLTDIAGHWENVKQQVEKDLKIGVQAALPEIPDDQHA